MTDERSPLSIGPLQPFLCSYLKDGKPYGIILYGVSAAQVIEDNCADLDCLSVDGILHETIPYDKEGDA